MSDHLPVVADFQLDAPPPNPQVLAAKWTFETSQPFGDQHGDHQQHCRRGGSGIARGVHVASATDYSNPVGNGSADSFSSNTWAVGDFYEFQISTEGYEDISIAFDQTSSNTGPRDFGIFYSTTGIGAFANTGITYTVLANDSPNPTWSSESPHAEFSFEFDLSGIAALDDQATMFLRLVDLSTTSASNGTVGTAGTSRVDNFSIFTIDADDLHGDFNEDGMVDAADYVVWRKTQRWRHGCLRRVGNQFWPHLRRYGWQRPTRLAERSRAGRVLAAGRSASVCSATRRGTLAAWTRRP